VEERSFTGFLLFFWYIYIGKHLVLRNSQHFFTPLKLRLLRRIIVLSCSFFAFLPIALTGQASVCVNADAGEDDTVCSGQCTLLYADISGTRQTNVYVSGTIPYAPYPFTGGNPVLVNLDDLWSPAVNIPFCFDFYGAVYTQLVIGTNGVITFDVSQANGTCPWTINVAAPNPGLPLNSIMAPFQDINPTIPTPSGATSINWNVYGTAPCRMFVVNWNDVAMYGTGCNSIVTSSQVVLHESTNIIDIFIRNKSVCSSWNNGGGIEGIQNATGSAATVFPGRNFPMGWSATNDGVQFIPAGAPNFSIQWLDPSNNVVSTALAFTVCPAQTTTYTLQVVNTSCNGTPVTVSDAVNVVVTQSTLTANDTSIYPTCMGSCNGMITILAANGVPPYTYTWTPNVSNGPVATNLCQGSYICEVTDGTGCSIAVIVNLTPPPPFTLGAAATPSLCNDSTGTAFVTITGGTGPFTIVWSNGDTTSNIFGLTPGQYQVIVTDSAGCPDSVLTTVAQTGLLLDTVTTQLVCNGSCNGVATVNVMSGTAPFTYNWMPYGGNGPTAYNLCSGFFLCTVTDSAGCSTTAVLPIASPPPITVTPSANQTICAGQSTTIGAVVTGGTPPYTYNWSNGLPPTASNFITPAQTTVYTLVVSDANGCQSALQTTLVKINNAPVTGFSSIEATCPPIMIDFTNLTDSAISYYWNFGDPASGANDTSTLISPSHLYSSGGNYTVTLIAVNAYGCADTLILPNAVQVPHAAVANASVNSTFLTTLDPVLLLNNSSMHAGSYIILFGDGDSLVTSSSGPYSHAYDSLGTFTITLIALNAEGCNDTTWLTVIIEEPTTVFIPNAFTPNGDGKNDFFMVYGVNIRQMHFLIFDRWGLLLFESDDVSNGWDGTYKGSRVQEDVYVWKLVYEDNFSGWHQRIGNVSVVR
jgi:gliding motility-associated-like protein